MYLSCERKDPLWVVCTGQAGPGCVALRGQPGVEERKATNGKKTEEREGKGGAPTEPVFNNLLALNLRSIPDGNLPFSCNAALQILIQIISSRDGWNVSRENIHTTSFKSAVSSPCVLFLIVSRIYSGV